MAHVFLSDDWFEAVKQAQIDHPEIEVPKELAELTFNMTIPDAPDGELVFHVRGAEMVPGKVDDAPIALTTPYNIAYKMIVKGDTMAIGAAFMRGKVKVRGDLRKLRAMSSAKSMDALRVIMDGFTAPVK